MLGLGDIQRKILVLKCGYLIVSNAFAGKVYSRAKIFNSATKY
jgi:hypothetical protein